MNQSEFLPITYMLKARKKLRLQGAIGLENCREVFKRSNRNCVITFDAHWKTALRRKGCICNRICKRFGF